MSSSDLNRQLQDAIRLAQAGQTAEARALLQQLTTQAPDLTAAWLWLATVAASPEERLAALRRVLELEPGNATARAALEQLGESLPLIPETPAETPPSREEVLAAALAPKPPKPKEPFLSQRDWMIIGVAAVLTLLVVLIAVVVSQQNSESELPRPTKTFTPSPSFTPSMTFTPAPPPPTSTRIIQPTLPPVWTEEPSQTPPPTRTLFPTWTPIPSRTPFPTFTPRPTINPWQVWG